jgi:Ca2+/Na+ antiporter
MDESEEERKRRRMLRTVALLWALATVMALVALLLDSSPSRLSRVMRGTMAVLFALVAFMNYRKSREPEREARPPGS